MKSFLLENKIKEALNNNQIYSCFRNVFFLNVDIWLFQIANASMYDLQGPWNGFQSRGAMEYREVVSATMVG